MVPIERKRTPGWVLALVITGACGSDSQPRIDTYLLPDVYTRLVIEIDAMDGAEPEPGTADRIEDQLAEVVGKPDGVFARLDQRLPPRGPDHVWSLDELRALFDATETIAPYGTAVMHTLIVDGRPPEAGTLGMSFEHRDVVLFKDALCGAERHLMDCRTAEHFVWLHEIGHVLGLVNNGTDMVVDHEDPEHPQHCDEEGCVMRWAYTRFRGSPEAWEEAQGGMPAFGSLCKMDLNGAREPL